MKKVFVFIGLKLVEITGVVFIPYFIGLLKIPQKMFGLYDMESLVGDWISGLLTIIAPIPCLLLCLRFLSAFIAINWKWAGNLCGKHRK